MISSKFIGNATQKNILKGLLAKGNQNSNNKSRLNKECNSMDYIQEQKR